MFLLLRGQGNPDMNESNKDATRLENLGAL